MPASRHLPKLLVLGAVVLVVPSEASAQCADGSPPPCASQRVANREVPRTIDPTRVAILPFRVTTTDTLLGEGFAELLASEFNEENGLRAIDMATVLSAWRRAGGGSRAPLSRTRMLALAASLGAGLVSEGSIVGIGKKITITANLVSVPGGAPRGRPTRVTSSADSVDAALKQTASGLIGAYGGAQRTLEGARYTDSPDAMRAYLTGLNAWRRGHLFDAVTSLERAMTLDTMFAQAAFRRLLTLSWALPAGTIPPDQVNRRVFALRDRLSPPERMIAEAVLGPNFPTPRTMEERFAVRQKVATLLPDSPEAQFLYGDYWLHDGAAIDPRGQLEHAREYIGRAVAIDSQATAMRHLIEVAARLRDTALVRRVLPAYARTEDSGRWPMLFFGYSLVGDRNQLATLRRQITIDTITGSQAALYAALVADIPAPLLDELIAIWVQALEGNSWRDPILYHAGTVLAVRGRPAAAERAWAAIKGTTIPTDQIRIALAIADMAEGLDVAGAMSRLMPRFGDPRYQLTTCELALLRLHQGIKDSVDASRFPASCGRTYRITQIPLDSGAATIAALERADSLLRNSLGNLRGYESSVLSRAWEKVGKPDRALRAIRYRNVASFAAESPWLYPEEIRLALVVGDTASAVRTLEYYLPIIADAEPPIAAKRDSLRALLTRLKRH